MNYEPASEKIILSLEKLPYKFSIRQIATYRNLITVHYKSSPVGYNCVLDILEGSHTQVNFLIRYPGKMSVENSPDMLLFSGLANSNRNIHPGYWNYNMENEELVYCCQWYCDPSGHHFEAIFTNLLNNCFVAYDSAFKAIKDLIDGKINADQAVGEFIKRTNAFFN